MKKAVAKVVEKELRNSEKTFESYIESAVKRGKRQEMDTSYLCDELEDFHETLGPGEKADKIKEYITQLREGSIIKRDALMGLMVLVPYLISGKKKEDDRTMAKIVNLGGYDDD